MRPFIVLIVLVGCSEAKPAQPTTASAPPVAASSDTSKPMQPSSLETLVGRPLSEVVANLGLDEKSFTYSDEPPAKLRIIRAERSANDRLEIHLKYDSAILFSTERSWPLSKIGAATVLGFVELRGNDRRAVGVTHEGL